MTGGECVISKYSPKRKDKLIKKNDMPEEIRRIPGTEDYYISRTGKIYRDYGDGCFYPIKTHVNARNGYVYAGLCYAGTNRVHRMVALTWIPNPNNYPVVGHKDNNRANPCADNLYWTTYEGNTHDAMKDGRMWQYSGYEDSQSRPVICRNENGAVIGRYGSEREAHKATGASVSTVTRQCKNLIKGRHRSGLYFEYQN